MASFHWGRAQSGRFPFPLETLASGCSLPMGGIQMPIPGRTLLTGKAQAPVSRTVPLPFPLGETLIEKSPFRNEKREKTTHLKTTHFNWRH